MKGALVILAVLVVTGALLYLYEWRSRKRMSARGQARNSDVREETSGSGNREKSAEESGSEDGSVCCGLHLVCEKESLSPVDAEVEYYDDEELDRFIGRGEEEYTQEEIEEFREVLYTLRGEDIAGWSRSITKRRITLPSEVRDELLMMVRERRGIE